MGDTFRRILDGILILGGAGILAACFQAITAVEAVRRKVLLLPTTWLLLEPEARRARRAIRSILERVVRGEKAASAELTAAIAQARPELDWNRTAAVTAATARRAQRKSGALLLDRLSYPDDIAHVKAFLARAADYASAMESSVPVEADDSNADPGPSGFAGLITAFTGSVVLADASDTSAGVFEEIGVLHRSAQAHHDGRTCDHRGLLGPGDYDGPVLDIRSVRRISHPTAARFRVLVESAATCYAATEDGAGGMGCKKLDPYMPPDAVRELAWEWRGGAMRKAAGSRRTTLLTAYVMLRTADDHLVFAQRGETRNGRNILSLSAGGVVEYAPGSGDRDDYGGPDVGAAVRRETLEEVGVDVGDVVPRPVCLFLANSVGRDRSGDLVGQVVACALYLASVDLTIDEVERRMRSRADPATGAFEVRNLEYVPIGDSPAHLADWLAANASRVDQHTAVGLAYSMRLRFEEEPTATALRRAFRSEPWWLRTDGAGPVRTCVPVGDLLGVPTADLLAAQSNEWEASWSARSGRDAMG